MRRKRIFTAFLAVAVIATISTPVFANNTVTSGECGVTAGSIIWTLDTDGTLALTGQGPMTDYNSSKEVPWSSVLTDIKSLDVGEGITTIGGKSFYSADNLTMISLPSSLREIHEKSFLQCLNLNISSLPDGIETIGDSAFYFCPKLELTHLPANLKTLGPGAFCNDKKIRIEKIPDGLTTIPRSAFGMCQNIANLVMPDSITTIEDQAFGDCENLVLDSLPSSLQSIGKGAFFYCTSLALTELPASLTTIGEEAFSGCEKLALSFVPNTVTTIGSNAFKDATWTVYTEHYIPDGNGSYKYAGRSTELFQTGATATAGIADRSNPGFENLTSIAHDNELLSTTLPQDYIHEGGTITLRRYYKDNSSPTIISDEMKEELWNCLIPYRGVYDGKEHPVFTASALPEGWSVAFSINEDGPYVSASPTVNHCSDNLKPYWFEFSHDGYDTYRDWFSAPFQFNIAPKSIAVTVNDSTITYGESPAYNGITVEGVIDGEPDPYSYLNSNYQKFDPVGTYSISANIYNADYKANVTPGTLTVEPKEVNLNWANYQGRTYGDGKSVTATVSGAVNGDVLCTLLEGGKRTAAGGPYTATVTALTGEKAANYKLPADASVTYSIAKAPSKTLADITVSSKFSLTAEQSKQIGRAGMPDDAGDLSYAKGTERTMGNVSVTSWSVDAATGEVKYTLKDGAIDDTVTFPVIIFSENYEASTVNLVLTLTEKDTPNAKADDITVTYSGNTVTDKAISGIASVPGTWTFKNTEEIKNVTDSGEKAVIFTPDDSVNFAVIEETIRVTIQKATLTGEPVFTPITESNKTLTDAALTPNAAWPVGTLVWTDAKGNALANTEAVVANISYGWTFIAEGGNYEPLTGSAVLYKSTAPSGDTTQQQGDGTTQHNGGDGAPSFSGSDVSSSAHSDSTLKTVTNGDGSKTVMKTDRKTGLKTEITTAKNGDETVVETTKDGTITTSVHKMDGYTSKTVAAPDGTVKETVTTPEGVKAESEKTVEGILTAKVELPAKTAKATVKLPVPSAEAGKAMVEITSHYPAQVVIPTEKANNTTVAVLLKEDGTEEILKTSYATEDGLKINIPGNATVVIKDNTIMYSDVPATHWAKDDIAFISAREIMQGTGEGKFTPNAPTTRATLITMLARLDGTDTSGSTTWYEKGISWARKTGISDGRNPEGIISREQLVTMLWRYAGCPESKQSLNAFTDSANISVYAETALAWAVENRIIIGREDKTLDPKGSPTRAEISAVLERFIISAVKC